jgi:hypothetical protein
MLGLDLLPDIYMELLSLSMGNCLRIFPIVYAVNNPSVDKDISLLVTYLILFNCFI